MALENPKYQVLRKDGKFEIRQYEGYITAEVEIQSDYDSALRQGFRILASYIFGNNRKKEHIPMTAPVIEQDKEQGEKIPMTAPVTSRALGEGTHLVSFIMPSRYTLDTLPQPNSEEIKFREVEPHQVAALRFSGNLKAKLLDKKTQEMKQWLDQNNLAPKGGFVSAQYNPPWIPGFLRRNEILVEI